MCYFGTCLEVPWKPNESLVDITTIRVEIWTRILLKTNRSVKSLNRAIESFRCQHKFQAQFRCFKFDRIYQITYDVMVTLNSVVNRLLSVYRITKVSVLIPDQLQSVMRIYLVYPSIPRRRSLQKPTLTWDTTSFYALFSSLLIFKFLSEVM
jgi:hypothetical protein